MPRGNSFANGATESGPGTPYRWLGGYQAPKPVSIYTLAEGGEYR